MFGIAASASAAGPSVQPTPTGRNRRTHSHSVTGADMHHPLPVPLLSEPPTTDIFAEIMDWLPNTSGSSTPGSNTDSDTNPLPGFIPYPFGLGATFDAPSSNGFLPMPRALREMQSFESGLTARAGDTIRRPDTPDSILPLSVSPDLHPYSSPGIISPDPELTPLPETSMHSRYSTSFKHTADPLSSTNPSPTQQAKRLLKCPSAQRTAQHRVTMCLLVVLGSGNNIQQW